MKIANDKNLGTLIISLLLLSGQPVWAEEKAAAASSFNISGEVTATTDYVDRGIDQTNRKPTLQASIDILHESGLKFGAFASGVKMDGGRIEFDPYVGYEKDIGAWKFEGGVVYNSYPGASKNYHYNYAELYANVGYDFGWAAITTSLSYSPNFAGDSGAAYYPELLVAVPLPHDFAIESSIGYQTVSDKEAAEFSNYTAYSLSLSYKLEPVTLRLQYSGTSMGKTEAVDGGKRIVFSISREF